MKNFSFFGAIVLTFTSLLSGCGKESDMAQVTINIGIPTATGLKRINLMEKFASLPAAASAVSCKQKNMFAAVRFNENDNQIFTYPISLTTQISTPPVTDDDVNSFFAGATLDAPIQILVPKGAAFDFGVFGAMTEAHDGNSDDVCDIHSGATIMSGTVFPNYVAVGRRKAAVNGDLVLNLKVFTLRSEASTSTPGCNDPLDVDNLNQNCAKKDFATLQKVALTGDLFDYVKIEYLKGSNRPESVFQAFNNWSANSVKIPDIFPVVIRYRYNGATTEGVQIIQGSEALNFNDPAPPVVAGTTHPFYIRRN